MKDALCIYHGNCFDGFGAAWVIRRAWNGNGLFHAGVYGDPLPDVDDRNVILVDFSYPRDMLVSLSHRAASVTWLDHHASVSEDHAAFTSLALPGEGAAMRGIFDEKRSGAGLAWDYCNRGVPRPALIDYIEDRDLYRFALPDSRLVHAALSSYPFDFQTWDQLMVWPIREFIAEGVTLERKHLRDIATLLPVVQRTMRIGGHTVPVANLPMTMTTDAGNDMAFSAPFAACYWDTPRGRVFSLRSAPDGLDVSRIAEKYGGGGHPHAAGFEMPRNWEGDPPFN